MMCTSALRIREKHSNRDKVVRADNSSVTTTGDIRNRRTTTPTSGQGILYGAYSLI